MFFLLKLFEPKPVEEFGRVGRLYNFPSGGPLNPDPLWGEISHGLNSFVCVTLESMTESLQLLAVRL
jgi:hypothetical protein